MERRDKQRQQQPEPPQERPLQHVSSAGELACGRSPGERHGPASEASPSAVSPTETGEEAAMPEKCNREILLRDRRQQQALLTPLSGDPKCPLLRDLQQQELVRQHTFDDTIRPKQLSSGALSLFSRAASDAQHPTAHASGRWRQVSLSKAEEELLAAGLTTMEDLSPEQAASIAAEMRAHAREQQQLKQQLQISGAVKSVTPAGLHPLHVDVNVAPASATAAASGRWGTSDGSTSLREVRSGQLHGETSDDEGTAKEAASRSIANQDQQRQQQQPQQQHEGESEEQTCERIAASIRFQAEADLNKRRAEMAALREDAERQLLSLQLLPPQHERLASLPASFREALFGVFVCLCLRHIEECDEDFRGEITTWALGLLDALASPHLLHLGAHIANCLSKPIAWREQLQKDGVRASDIVTLDPLIHKMEAFFAEKQAETDELFRSVQLRLRASRSAESPADDALREAPDAPCSGSSGSSSNTSRNNITKGSHYTGVTGSTTSSSSSSSSTEYSHGPNWEDARRGSTLGVGGSAAEASPEQRQHEQQQIEHQQPVGDTDPRMRALLQPPPTQPGIMNEQQQQLDESQVQQQGDFSAVDGCMETHAEVKGEPCCHRAVNAAAAAAEVAVEGEIGNSQQPGGEQRTAGGADGGGLRGPAQTTVQGTAAIAVYQEHQRPQETFDDPAKPLANWEEGQQEQQKTREQKLERNQETQPQDGSPSEQQLLQQKQLQQGQELLRRGGGCTHVGEQQVTDEDESDADAPSYARGSLQQQQQGEDEVQEQQHGQGDSSEACNSSDDERGLFEGGAVPSSLSMWASEPPAYRVVFLRELTTALVTNGTFDARIQMLLDRLATELRINPLLLIRIEENLAADLLSILQANTKEGSKQKTWRRLKIAGAAVGGGVLLALTAGLAAPGIAAAVASLGSLPLSAFLASAGGMAALVSIFGAGGAGLTGWKYSRRIANIKIFEFLMLNGRSPSSLRVGIGVSGYLRDDDDVTLPWVCSFPNPRCDLHALKWEPHVLKALGGMVIKMVSQDFAVSASKFYLQYTVLGGLTFALFWPIALIQYAAGLDNTWMLCRERAQQAGNILADAVSDKAAVGQRPVTLAGYSMGARVIFYCLQALWKKRKFHCVHDVVLMGLPASMNAAQWRQARQVTSGRLVNVYCRTDWLLAFLYRWMEFRLQVAGLAPVTSVPGVENVDVTGLVKSHAHYPEKVPQIMSFISIEM